MIPSGGFALLRSSLRFSRPRPHQTFIVIKVKGPISSSQRHGRYKELNQSRSSKALSTGIFFWLKRISR